MLTYCFLTNSTFSIDLFKHVNSMSITKIIENLIIFECVDDSLAEEILVNFYILSYFF